MQPRKLALKSNPNFILFIAESRDILSNSNPLPDYPNAVIIYPNPNDSTGSSTGRRIYKACVKADNKLVADANGKVIEVSMGDQHFPHKGYLLQKEYGPFITETLQQFYQTLSAKGVQIPASVNVRLAFKNMQETLQENDRPRQKRARELQQEQETKKQKEEEDKATEEVILHLIATDLNSVEEETKSNTLEQKNLLSCKVLKRKTHPDLNKDAEEVAPLVFPEVIENLIFEHTVNFDNTPNKAPKKHDFPNMPAAPQYACLTLFGRPFLDMTHTLGSMVLASEENNVEMVLNEVKKNPTLLDIVITVEDRLETPVTGTLLQLAAMAGDVTLRRGIRDEKCRGLVERLADAGKLSKERVTQDLACITSKEAQIANDVRVKRYLAIIKKFGNSLYEGKVTKEEAIFQLKKELFEERRKPVKTGFIFDLRILHDTVQWFKKNVDCFNGLESPESDVFWVNGFGRLQSLLSTRALQVLMQGIWAVLNGEMAKRLCWDYQSDDFFSDGSSGLILGQSFYLEDGFRTYYISERRSVYPGTTAKGALSNCQWHISLNDLYKAQIAALERVQCKKNGNFKKCKQLL